MTSIEERKLIKLICEILLEDNIPDTDGVITIYNKMYQLKQRKKSKKGNIK